MKSKKSQKKLPNLQLEKKLRWNTVTKELLNTDNSKLSNNDYASFLDIFKVIDRDQSKPNQPI